MGDAVDIVTAMLGEQLASGRRTDMADWFADDERSAAMDRLMAPDAVIEFPAPDGGFIGDMAGPWRGPEGMRAAWREWLGAWPSFALSGARLIDADGNRVLLLAGSVGRTESGMEIEAQVAALYTVRDGRIVALEHFLDQEQARRAAGV